jgi:hypothetical protein
VARGGIEPPTYRFSGVHALALYGFLETRRIQSGRSSVKVKGGSSSIRICAAQRSVSEPP